LKSFLKYLMPILFTTYCLGGTAAGDKASLIKDQKLQPSSKEFTDANGDLIRGPEGTIGLTVKDTLPETLGETKGGSPPDLNMDKVPMSSAEDEILVPPTMDEIPPLPPEGEIPLPPTMDEIPPSPTIDAASLLSGSEVAQPRPALDNGEATTPSSPVMPSANSPELSQRQDETEEQKAKRAIAQNKFQVKALQRAQQRQRQQHLEKQEAAESQERERSLQKQSSLHTHTKRSGLASAPQAKQQLGADLTDEHGNLNHGDEFKSKENQGSNKNKQAPLSGG